MDQNEFAANAIVPGASGRKKELQMFRLSLVGIKPATQSR